MKYVFQLFGKITGLMNGINDLIKKYYKQENGGRIPNINLDDIPESEN